MDDKTLPGSPPQPPTARPLSELLGAAMEPRRAAALARQVAQALSAAHAQGLACGDLRPSSVFVEEDGAPRLPRLAPQEAGRDAARDQFMLGAVLYQMITGRRPFEGTATPEAPSSVLASIPEGLGAIALRALAEDPTRRYASLSDMAADLGRFLAGDPVEAARRPERASRRGPWIAVAAIVVAVAAVAAWKLWPRHGPAPQPVPVHVPVSEPAPVPVHVPAPEPAPSPKPDLAAEHLKRGLELFSKGDANGAIAEYDLAISLDPKHVETIASRAVAKHMAGDLDAAIADCDLALSIDAKYAPAWLERGFAKWGKKDRDGAIADYDRAIEADPSYAEAYFNRGRTRQAKDDLDGALSDYNEAIKKKGKYPEALFQRGKLKEKKGDNAGAMADYVQCLRVAPKGWPQRAKVEERMKALFSGKEGQE